MLARLLDDHARIRELCDELATLLEREKPGSLEVLADCRWRLARLILRHLPVEDRHVYQRLEQHGDPAAAALTRASRRRLDDIYGAFQQHADAWTPEQIVERWPLYRERVKHLVARLMMRMDHEETELYPFLEGAPEVLPERRPDDRNWAADAWDIKAKIAGG